MRIYVAGLRYTDLKTMSVYPRATQLPEVSQKDLGCLVDVRLGMSQLYASAAKAASSILGCMRSCHQTLCAALVRHIQDLCPDPSSQCKDVCVLERVQWRATEMIKRWENYAYGERQRELRLISLEKRGYLTSLFLYLMVKSKGDRAWLSSVLHKSKYGKFCLSMIFFFSTWDWSNIGAGYPQYQWSHHH